jgi:hypothetical protein
MPFITQEKRFTQVSEHYQAFELQSIPKSKFCTNIIRNSKHLLPLSYMDVPENARRGEIKRLSNETSISSFVGANPSPASSDFHVSGPSALEAGKRHRSDSIEELVEDRG